MRDRLHNPVARMAARAAGGGRWWLILSLFAASALAGAGLQVFWAEVPVYAVPRRAMLDRWLGMTLLAEAGIVLAWSALRGVLVWRGMRRQGVIEEWRRTRMSPAEIVVGVVAAAARPAWLLLAVSLAASLAATVAVHGPAPGQVLTAHLVLAGLVPVWTLLGVRLSGRLPAPAAVPLAGLALAGALGLIVLLDPFLPRLSDPPTAIFLALLPNPLTSVGSALGTDVLRFGWLYDRLHAHEYPFIYPPWWSTLLVFGVIGGLLLRRQAGLLRSEGD